VRTVGASLRASWNALDRTSSAQRSERPIAIGAEGVTIATRTVMSVNAAPVGKGRAMGDDTGAVPLVRAHHPCVTAIGEAEVSTAAVRLLSDGLSDDEQLGYFGWGVHRDLMDRLPTLVDGAMARAGAVRVTSLAERFDRSSPPDPAALVAFWADASDDAVAAGFTALRAVMDTTPWLAAPDGRALFMRGDHLLDGYCLDHPLTVICVCDAGMLDAGTIAEITSLHAVAYGPSAPFHLHAAAGADFALSGEIDTLDTPVLERVLSMLDLGASKTKLVIDASRLGFVNHRALLALDRHAERMGVDELVIRTSSISARRLAGTVDLRRVRIDAVGAAV
jgi:hypothetical protein